MKKVIYFLLLALLCREAAWSAPSASPLRDAIVLKLGSPKALVGLSEKRIDDQNHRVVPVLQNDRTLLPLRFIAENFGAKVSWDGNTQTATVSYEGRTARVTLDSPAMTVDDTSILLDVPAALIDNRTFLPLRRLAEDLLGKSVFYEDGVIVLSPRPFQPEQGLVPYLQKALKDNMGRLHYMVNYGLATPELIEAAKTYDLVIIHPLMGKWTREQVAEVQMGVDPGTTSDDVIVLGYISIGEDLRTSSLTDGQLQSDPRFRGDGAGPRVDPRGPQPNGGASMEGIAPLGAPSPGGGGFTSFYLDDNDGDGLPDRNKYFGGAFVNAGDPAWFEAIDAFTADGPDGLPGLREILTDSYGRGLGCDGVFLDTIDTCAPNSYTDENSPNQSEFEWTAPGFSSFIGRVRDSYPGKYILQNRGLFFFDPRLPHYRYTTRENIDFLMFESYMLDSNETYSEAFYQDNKNAAMPKVMAAAGLPDGFRVLSLGYAAGAARPEQTLRYEGTAGRELFLEELRQTEELAGFSHFFSDPEITSINNFARKETAAGDSAPPVWSATYNAAAVWPPGPPAPRAGAAQAVPKVGGVTLRFDVALDKNRVQYVAYYQKEPFDFAKDPRLEKAEQAVLFLRPGTNYAHTTDTYPFEADIDGLESGAAYYFVVRARDTSPDANEEQNQTVVSAVPL